jgi:hypothetical protein
MGIVPSANMGERKVCGNQSALGSPAFSIAIVVVFVNTVSQLAACSTMDPCGTSQRLALSLLPLCQQRVDV